MAKKDNSLEVFNRLKAIMQECASSALLQADNPEDFSLTLPPSARFPKGFFVGGVQLRKNYVSYHLMPVYIFPDLLDGLSDPLKKRMQGKSCFNFTNVDETLFAELKQLTASSFAHFRDSEISYRA